MCKVNGMCQSRNDNYKPEILLCQYLDITFPEQKPHFIYAYYARDFCIGLLRNLYEMICGIHNIHAVVCVDGGSDSLMVGDEDGLGDPIEDAVSIGAIFSLASPSVKYSFLLCVGIGADRYNDVSDTASLRAIAELTAAGGFRGGFCLEPNSDAFLFYKNAVQYIYANQSFQSVLAGVIVSSIEGYFGSETIPDFVTQSNRLRPGDIYFWPISGMVFAFDIKAVAERSQIIKWIYDCTSVKDCHNTLRACRSDMGRSGAVKPEENLPIHSQFSVIKKTHQAYIEGFGDTDNPCDITKSDRKDKNNCILM